MESLCECSSNSTVRDVSLTRFKSYEWMRGHFLLNYILTFAAITEVCIVISVNVWIIELCAQFRYMFEKSCLCSLHLFLSCLIRFLFSITYQRYSCRDPLQIHFHKIPIFIFSIKYNKTSRSYATNTRKSTGLTPSCEQWWSGFCKARWFYSWCRFKHCKQSLKFRFRKTHSTANRAPRVFIQTWNQIWSNYKTLCIARQVYKLIT